MCNSSPGLKINKLIKNPIFKVLDKISSLKILVTKD